MKTIGLIGGMSWESTVTYYQTINRVTREKLGGLHSAKCHLYSVDFQEIEECQANGDWDKSAEILSAVARKLEGAGADFIVICTNTMHKVADRIGSAVRIPILHIADLTADALLAKGIRRVGLLGTKYTMEQDFYKSRLVAKGIEVRIPDETERAFVNATIYDELCLGVISPSSKAAFIDTANRLAAEGAQGIILGCTEIGLLLKQEDTPTPLFDTTQIHAESAALFALGQMR